MKLIHDCVRDVMLFLENNLTYEEYLYTRKIKLNKYKTNDILYTLDKLSEAGFITITGKTMDDDNFYVTSITYNGHQFLDNIRDSKVWKQTKSILSTFTSTSLGIVQNIASQVISNIITGK